jgi:type II secretory pathway pseudopilin PulG
MNAAAPHRQRAQGAKRGRRSWAPPLARRARAFTLLEVMIACGIFFMATFAILALVSNSLRQARRLRRLDVDAGMVAAQILIRTNRWSEGTESGDFGDVYPDCSWRYEASLVESNGLMQFDITVLRRGLRDPVDHISILVFTPESAALPGAGGLRPRP